jgi:hypothetical protein
MQLGRLAHSIRRWIPLGLKFVYSRQVRGFRAGKPIGALNTTLDFPGLTARLLTAIAWLSCRWADWHTEYDAGFPWAYSSFTYGDCVRGAMGFGALIGIGRSFAVLVAERPDRLQNNNQGNRRRIQYANRPLPTIRPWLSAHFRRRRCTCSRFILVRWLMLDALANA